jgi:hypothetical protein
VSAWGDVAATLWPAKDARDGRLPPVLAARSGLQIERV